MKYKRRAAFDVSLEDMYADPRSTAVVKRTIDKLKTYWDYESRSEESEYMRQHLCTRNPTPVAFGDWFGWRVGGDIISGRQIQNPGNVITVLDACS